jgi:long-subunit fatty acid transport protein
LTISDTVTHRWTDNLALSVRLGWDRGVSTGWTDNPTTWSALFFANYKFNEHLEVTGGVGMIYVPAGETNKAVQPGGFTATTSTGNILFTSLGFRSRF